MPAWDKILIHHSAGPDGASLDREAIRRHHVEVNKWADIGYHFVVEKVGSRVEVIAGRPLDQDGAHCPGQNSRAIGICFIGDFTAEPPSREALETAAHFIRGLCFALKISRSAIYPHREFRSTECPGKSFPMGKLRDLVDQ